LSLAVTTVHAVLLMRWLRSPGIALGSSIGAFLNTTLHRRDLSRRIGSVLRGPDWRAFGIALAAGLVAGAGAVGAGHLTSGLAPAPRGLLVLVIFGMVYGALTLLLKHPDAIRTGHALTASHASETPFTTSPACTSR